MLENENTFPYIQKVIAILLGFGALYAFGRWSYLGMLIYLESFKKNPPLSSNPELITQQALLISGSIILFAAGLSLWFGTPFSLFLCALPLAIVVGLSTILNLRIRRHYENRLFKDDRDEYDYEENSKKE